MVKATAIGPEVSNGAVQVINNSVPYTANVVLTGVSDILFHRWNCEAVEAQGKTAKGSKGRKTDVIENYVWRNDDGDLCRIGFGKASLNPVSVIPGVASRRDNRARIRRRSA